MTPAILAEFTAVLGAAGVLTGEDVARYRADWTTHYPSNPVAVLRPADTLQVSDCVKIAARHSLPLVPIGGLTGITGAAQTNGVMLSLERMNKILDIRANARIAVVQAGVVISALHSAAEDLGLYFPLWFGARGSAMIGGVLSTNAGGSNVLRYGSTRGLCMGLEVVLPDGRILNLMSQLHKDNSGYDLKQMFIGAEGTLGIITAAVVKLVPKPRAYATATLAARSLDDALVLLNRLQMDTGGMVEAFEYMPRTYMQRVAQFRPDLRQPFDPIAEVAILVELGAVRASDADALPDGSLPVTSLLENTLAQMIDEGMVLNAEIAQNDAQRAAMWARRECAAEVMQAVQPSVDTDICLPTDQIATFLDRMAARLPALDPGATSLLVAHLGDGNLHYSAYPSHDDPALYDAIVEAVEDIVQDMNGSFSAEHGVGQMKLNSMRRRKDPVALDLMRLVKAALDPQRLMNPGKVIPE